MSAMILHPLIFAAGLATAGLAMLLGKLGLFNVQ